MNILAICSALNNSYLAFEYENEVYSKIIRSDENYHSLYLIQNIKNFLSENNIKLADFDAISVNCGPGSFTGIRVALTIAKVMAGELDKPLIPLNTSEILLNAYNCDYLIMDARRDMYFKCDKDSIELIKKDELEKYINNINNSKTVCDKRSLELFNKAVCFENTEIDLGKTIIKLAKEKYENSKNKEDFNYMNIKANYIQTPPVF